MHHCPFPGCSRKVRASRLACAPHWYMLPKSVRSRIWAHYVPGQTLPTISSGYAEALADALAYWTSHSGVKA